MQFTYWHPIKINSKSQRVTSIDVYSFQYEEFFDTFSAAELKCTVVFEFMHAFFCIIKIFQCAFVPNGRKFVLMAKKIFKKMLRCTIQNLLSSNIFILLLKRIKHTKDEVTSINVSTAIVVALDSLVSLSLFLSFSNVNTNYMQHL